MDRRRAFLRGVLPLTALLVFVVACTLTLGVVTRAANGEEAERSGIPAFLHDALETPPELEGEMPPKPERGSSDQEQAFSADVELERSRSAFRDLTPDEAEKAARVEFPQLLSSPLNPGPTLVEGERIAAYPEANVAQLIRPGGQPAVFESQLPMLTEGPEGKQVPVDLALREADGVIESVHPLVPVELPGQLEQGFRLPDIGLALIPQGTDNQPLRGDGVIAGVSAFYANSQVDTDTLAKPTPTGFKTETLLRSPESPEVLRFRIAVPGEKLVLERGPDGSISVSTPEATLATIAPVTAVDAAGTTVSVETTVAGDELGLRVPHRSESYQYPIAVDPAVTEHNSFIYEWERGPWVFSTNAPSVFETPFTEGHPWWGTVSAGAPYSYNQYGAWTYWTQGQSRIFSFEPYVWSTYPNDKMQSLVGIIGPGGWEASQWLGTYVNPAVKPTLCPGGSCSEASGSAGNVAVFERIAIDSGTNSYGAFQNYGVKITQNNAPSVQFDTSSPTLFGKRNALYLDGWTTSDAVISAMASDPGIGIYKRGLTKLSPPYNWEGTIPYGANPGCAGIQCDQTVPMIRAVGNLPEGESEIEARAENAIPWVASAKKRVKIDNVAPTMELSGLASGHIADLGKTNKLNALVADTGGVTPNSGIAGSSIKFWVDGKLVSSSPANSCSPGPCQSASTYSFLGRDLGLGEHAVKVEAKDNAGNPVQRELQVAVVAERGPLVDLGPGQLNPANGDYQLTQRDVSAGVAGAGLSVTRSYQSLRQPNQSGPFGSEWQISLGGWQGVTELSDGSVPFTDAKGHELVFDLLPGGGYGAPTKYPDWSLTYSKGPPATFTLTDASGDVTTFTRPGESGSIFVPSSFTGPSGTQSTTFSFETVGGETRPSKVLGPVPAGVSCTTLARGCRALTFDYATSTTASGEGSGELGDYEGRLERVELHAWDPESEDMAAIGVAEYEYDAEGRLRAAWDPRVDPPLKTSYAYDAEGRLTIMQPPGLQPWLFHYGSIPGQAKSDWLLSVSRPSASTPLGATDAPENTAAPHFSGVKPEVGTPLYVWNGSWDNEPWSFTYQWERCLGSTCGKVWGATGQSYTPVAIERGYAFRVRVTATNAAGSATAVTSSSAALPSAGTHPFTRAVVLGDPILGKPGSGNGQFNGPQGIATDSAQNVWVVDTKNNRVQEFSRTGAFLRQFGTAGAGNGQFSSPVGIAVGPNGYVWVADTGNNRIQKFSSTGAYLSQFGTKGSGSGQLNSPRGLAIDPQGNVWVADSANNRIQKFSSAGQYLSKFGQAGSGNGAINAPNDVAVNFEGNRLWVASTGRVQEFDAAGAFLRRIGTEAAGASQLVTPVSVAADSLGRIWVADMASPGRLVEFSADGKALAESAATDVPKYVTSMGLDVDSEGNVWATEVGLHRVAKWVSKTAAYDASFGEEGSGDGQVQSPSGVATDPDGHVWVADTGNNRIQEFSATGEYLGQFGEKGSANGQLDSPHGLAVDADGHIWVADTNNHRVQEFTQTGDYLRRLGKTGGVDGNLNAPQDVAIAPNGDIWVADTNNNRIQRYSATGEYLSKFGTEGTGDGQFKRPSSLAIDPEGHIWIVDRDNYRVQEFSSSGAYLDQFGGLGSEIGKFKHPVGIDADEIGGIWVVDDWLDRVQRFNSEGDFLGLFNGDSPGGEDLFLPAAIDLGPFGRISIAESYRDQVQQWSQGAAPGGESPGPPPPNPLGATLTVAYNVPISGPAAPYAMSSTNVGKWAQGSQAPTEATAVFPPDQVPADPAPSDYRRATIYYMDGRGDIVNIAAPGGRISTEEHDAYGNVTRKLTPEGRARALDSASSSSASKTLDTQLTYSADGTELLSVLGPQHKVRLSSGEEVEARLRTRYSYGEGQPAGGPYHLVTKQTEAAQVGGQELDVRTKTISYAGQSGLGWELRQPTSETVDPGGLALTTKVFYDADTGNPVETRMPGGPEGGDAHSAQAIYYTAGSNEVSECGGHPEWAGLLCRSQPSVQPGTLGLPDLPVTATDYNIWNQPVTSTETVGGDSRTATIDYDEAGRPVEAEIVATSGEPLPPVATEYDQDTGLPTVQQAGAEFLLSEYNSLGQLTTYTDADGNISTYTYDAIGRPREVSDGKGTQTASYDATTGDLTKLADSGVGAFTASYDAGGKPVRIYYPNGMRAEYGYDAAGMATSLRYLKRTHCTEKCIWYSEETTPSIHGETLKQTSTLASLAYSFDAAGRITKAQETPAGKGCMTRLYGYDADSNRTSLTTRSPGGGGECGESGGTTQATAFDTADRLLGGGIAYSPFGNITALSAESAGGSALSSTYYVDDSVASMSQAGQTLEYGRDPQGRVRETVESGASEGDEVSHFSGPGDAPAWTEDASGNWSRYVSAFGGLIAIQDSGGQVRLQATDLHGDIIGTTSISELATGLDFSGTSTEFGAPTDGIAPGKYAWLGTAQRPTELPSGIVNMGERTYVPQLGRFLQKDPVQGGSANSYSYAFGNPINEADLSGEYTPQVPPWIGQYLENPPGMPPPPPSPADEAAFIPYEVDPTVHGEFGHLHISWIVTSCTIHVGCNGDFTFSGNITGRGRSRSVMRLWISMSNPNWSTTPLFEDFYEVYGATTPTYQRPIYVPIGTVFIFHLYVKVGRHKETLEFAVFFAEGEIHY